MTSGYRFLDWRPGKNLYPPQSVQGKLGHGTDPGSKAICVIEANRKKGFWDP